jgi:hypothetical protein
MKDRFERLAALTRGAALLTLGAGAVAAGCTKNEPAPQPTVAAGSTQADLTAPAVDASDADAGPLRPRHRFPIPNAMRPDWRFRDAGPSGGADGGPASGP